MAGDERDPLAFIADDCGYSSSQEELLSHAKFCREGGTFPDEEESQARQRMHRKLDGADDSGAVIGTSGAESAAGDANRAGAENLGFGGDRKGVKEGEAEASGTKLEGGCGGEREVEPQLKKFKVSPLIHCSGKMVIEGEDDGQEVVGFCADLKVEKVSTLRAAVPESAGCTEKLSCEGEGDDVGFEGEMGTSGVKRKLEFVLDTEVVNVGDEEGNSEKGGDCGEGSGKVEVDDEKKGDVKRKRELPRSMFGLGWGEGTEDAIGNRVGVDGSGDVEGGLKEASVEGKIDEELKCDEEETVCGKGSGDGNGNVERGVKEANVEGKIDEEVKYDEEETVCGKGSGDGNGNVERGVKEANVEGKIDEEVKCDEEETVCGKGSGDGKGNVESGVKEANVEGNSDGRFKGGGEGSIWCILDVLRVLVGEKCSNDDSMIDVFETAKRCGMTFPRSRFLPEVEKDE